MSARPKAPHRGAGAGSAATYPRCQAAFIPVAQHATGFSYVPSRQMILALDARGPTFRARFNALFGIQTQCEDGPYAWDVEAVLERMASDRRTGSQLIWD